MYGGHMLTWTVVVKEFVSTDEFISLGFVLSVHLEQPTQTIKTKDLLSSNCHHHNTKI